MPPCYSSANHFLRKASHLNWRLGRSSWLATKASMLLTIPIPCLLNWILWFEVWVLLPSPVILKQDEESWLSIHQHFFVCHENLNATFQKAKRLLITFSQKCFLTSHRVQFWFMWKLTLKVKFACVSFNFSSEHVSWKCTISYVSEKTMQKTASYRRPHTLPQSCTHTLRDLFLMKWTVSKDLMMMM